ncbi:MAG: excinuclease ABC subunit C [Halovenus sp.]
MDAETVSERAASLPREPGVYQFLDDGTVLYVGKAVALRDRVRSYADANGDASGARSERIRQMVDRADEIEVAVTESESQALLLEANLIKRHQPRYNVRLKDDKSYPLVTLTDHEFPQIRVTRDPSPGATAFGPFTDKGLLETVVKALREVYGVRGCSDHKYANRDRPCLDYDIGLCTAPCTDEIDRESYLADVEAVERFFGGETGILTGPLRREMERAAQDREYERAAHVRDLLTAVERFHDSGADAVHSAEGGPSRTDVVGVSLAGDAPTVAVLHAEHGQLVDRERHTLDAPDRTDDPGAVLGAFLPQYYADRERPDVLLCSDRPAGETLERWLESVGVDLRVPGAGREATLVDLALKNASRTTVETDASAALAAKLGLSGADRIEGFDVSHAHGSAAVGSNVVFVDGSPEKAGYRRKRLADTNDDYENMRRLLRWRAERAVEGRDDRPDPDLLLVDGGAAQRDAAREALAAVGWDRPVVGLAKAEERVVTDEGTHDWSADAEHLRLLQRVRDEAHRFAVQYHETIRDDVSTPLDDVPGVGPELRRRLLGRFGSVDGVREASREELVAVPGVGAATAARIESHL